MSRVWITQKSVRLECVWGLNMMIDGAMAVGIGMIDDDFDSVRF